MMNSIPCPHDSRLSACSGEINVNNAIEQGVHMHVLTALTA